MHFMTLKRKPFLSIDGRWLAKTKWLWDEWAGPHETYSGYIDYWDEVPWQEVPFDDGVTRDYNNAARAQYLPSYAGEILGTVGDLIEYLERDHIDTRTIEAQYAGDSVPENVALRNLFYRYYNPAHTECPIVYSRPVTYTFEAKGHIGDNSHQAFFVRADESCDGTEGMHEILGVNYRREFFADAVHYFRTFPGALLPNIPAATPYQRLVCYIIGAGSIGRISINGVWKVVSPGVFGSSGNPYNFVYRGYKAVVIDHGLRFGEGETNEIIVEHIAPRPIDLGAQVIFSLEWFEEKQIIVKTKTRRKKMSRSINKDLAQGVLVIKEDNKALAAGEPWALLPALRTEHDNTHADLQLKQEDAHYESDILRDKVAVRNSARQVCEHKRRAIQLYVTSVHDKEKAEKMLGLLNLEKPVPNKNYDALESFKETRNQLPHYDGTPDEIPAEYKQPFKDALTQFENDYTDTQIQKGVVNDGYEERDIIHHDYAELLSRIRDWLINNLPQGIHDEKLGEYGFDPMDPKTHPTPEIVEGLTGEWVPENKYVVLNWQAAEEANDYEVYYGIKPTDPNAHTKFKRLAKTDNLFYYYQKAKAGKTYVFKVRGVTHFRQGEFSVVIEVERPAN